MNVRHLHTLLAQMIANGQGELPVMIYRNDREHVAITHVDVTHLTGHRWNLKTDLLEAVHYPALVAELSPVDVRGMSDRRAKPEALGS